MVACCSQDHTVSHWYFELVRKLRGVDRQNDIQLYYLALHHETHGLESFIFTYLLQNTFEHFV